MPGPQRWVKSGRWGCCCCWLLFLVPLFGLNMAGMGRNQASILLLEGRNLDGLGGWSGRQSKEGELLGVLALFFR